MPSPPPITPPRSKHKGNLKAKTKGVAQSDPDYLSPGKIKNKNAYRNKIKKRQAGQLKADIPHGPQKDITGVFSYAKEDLASIRERFKEFLDQWHALQPWRLSYNDLERAMERIHGYAVSQFLLQRPCGLQV
jgi:hypothetical protein